MPTTKIKRPARGGSKIGMVGGKKTEQGLTPGTVPPSHVSEDNNSPDGGKNVNARYRFASADDLKHRYEDTRNRRGTMNSWVNILRQYERLPYRDKQGNPKANFGQLRYKVDQALTTFVDFATERETWARIITEEGDDDANSKTWSEHITAAFQKFCIKPWKKSSHEVMISAKDMLLFNNGILAWDNDHAVYPESLPTEKVWPDVNAGQFPEDWDVLFVEKTFTAVELFEKIEDIEVARAHGWNRNAVMRILRSSNDCFKDSTITDTFEEFRLGGLAADIQDFRIDVVIGYVREFHADDDGKKVSKFVFTRAKLPQKGNTASGTSEMNNATEYLLDKKNCHVDMGEIIGVLNQTPARSYYENTSFGQLIYTSSKQYDILMNRILEAVEDNMRVYLKTDNPEQLEKLQRMRHGSFQILDPETKIEQDRMQRPIKDAADVMRMVMIDQNTGTGQYQVGQGNTEGGPKTATQTQVDLSESTKISSAHLKMFNLFMTFTMCEMFRRWTTVLEKGDMNYDKFLKFKKYLQKRGVPDKAWKPENVTVESVISLGAGSPAAKLQGGQIILQTLATPARTPGERQAKRDIISSVVGVENADAYLPKDEDLQVPEDSLIGLENESLMNPMANPANIPVHPDHLHMRHIPAHIGSMDKLVSIAEGMFEQREQLGPADESVILKTIGDALIGADNIGAHAVAHIQIAGATGSVEVKQQLKLMSQNLNEVNARQDKLEQILGEVQEKRMQEAQEQSGQDPEFNHKQKMFALEEEHKQKMLEFDRGKEVSKAEQLRNQSAANAQQKNQLEVEKAQADVTVKQQKAVAEVQAMRIKANGSQESN